MSEEIQVAKEDEIQLIKAAKLIEKYGIQPLFNYKEQTLPAVAYAGVLPYSPSNFCEEPLPFFPVDHFRNKNRFPRTLEEREELTAEVFGECKIHTVGFNILIEHLTEINEVRGTHQITEGIENEWQVGRIIAMGESCWDHLKYPMGARAALGDYVIYSRIGTDSRELRDGVLVVRAKDHHIEDVIECPIKLLEA